MKARCHRQLALAGWLRLNHVDRAFWEKGRSRRDSSGRAQRPIQISKAPNGAADCMHPFGVPACYIADVIRYAWGEQMRGLIVGLPLSCLLWLLIFASARSLFVRSDGASTAGLTTADTQFGGR
jgi:hypothetical protein